MRTLIDLPDEMAQALKEIGLKRKASRAQLVREAVHEYLSRQGTADPDRGFGAWGKRTGDGVAWQRKVRAEW